MSGTYSYYPSPSSHHSSHHSGSHRSYSHSRAMSETRGPVYISSGSSHRGSHHGGNRYYTGSSYGGSSYVYPERDRERYASVTTLHRPPPPRSMSLTSLVGEPSITVIPPSRSRSRTSFGYEPQYTEDGRLRLGTVVRRLFGLGPRPLSEVKVSRGGNRLFPRLRRSRSKASTSASATYVYPSHSYESRRAVQEVYRS